MAANIDNVVLTMVGGERLKITQDGHTVIITSDADFDYEVITVSRKGSCMELQFGDRARWKRGKITEKND